MRILITATGIQDYIFNITERKASARLRGRSARLGLVMDLCLLLLQQEFGGAVEVKRNAGSRLEVEIPSGIDAVRFLDNLRRELDEHSHRDLNGEVWFAIGCAATQDEAYKELDDGKFAIGKAILQIEGKWEPEQFVFERWPSERALQNPEDADATTLPEAVLGRDLVEMDNHLINFHPVFAPLREQLCMLGQAVEVKHGRVFDGFCVALQDAEGNTVQQTHKRLARYAPQGRDGQLLDLDEIADLSTGAKFLGVLKADLDRLGETFKNLNGEDSKKLSEHLEGLFTDGLENLIRSNANYGHIYVVYSGGDDLFLLGPWDKLIRFIDEFHSQVEDSLKDCKPKPPTLSAGFKLAHPKSPVRFLADDVEAALDDAKGRGVEPTKLKPKNRIAVFERVILWDELKDGLIWADRFITGASEQNLSRGFLQRLQYYSDLFRQFFDEGKIEGLKAVPLLQDDWRRNIARVKEPLKTELTREVQPKLTELGEQGERMWRVIEFASRFAIYALR
jgi:CRISPR-associated protein Csm1